MRLIHFFIVLIGFSNCLKAQSTDSIPVHQTFTIQSVHVGEVRTINVWLPEDYASKPTPLPVMYMADGGINEDFPHIANTLAELIKQQKIKPIILVGIENTQRRRDLTGFTEVAKDKEIAPVVGGSSNFRAFIKDELFAEIEKRYRTTSVRTIIGESLSGLFVMETFFLTPNMFDNYIAFDPSFWWNNAHLIHTANENLSKFPQNEKRLWFAGSNAKDVSANTKKLAKILRTQNISNLKWLFSDEPNEKHSTIFRATKEKAIIWTLN